jgi:glycosyltransferase involved in cell wall biosynthesis
VRIAEILNTLEIGGLERMVVDLSIQLQDGGHQPTVICLRGSGPLAQSLAEHGIEAMALGKPEGFHGRTLKSLTAILRAGSFDVVHTHNPVVHHYGAIGGRLAGVPVIVNTRHGLGNYPRMPKTEKLFELACTLTDRVAVVCGAARDFFQRHSLIPRRKFTLIRNGIPLAKFLALPFPGASAPFVFGTVGRLVPVKNQRLLLEAFALLAARRPGCRLEILGDGPLREELGAFSRSLGIAGAVAFHGSSLEVPTFLRRLNTFVLTSSSEGLPLTILEAMAAGLPVVATAVGGIPEIIRAADCGWLCEESLPQALATQLAAAVDTREARSIGGRGRQYVAQEHSLEKMAQDYEQLFQSILQEKGRGSA